MARITMIFTNKIRLATNIAALLTLTACGGSGSGSSSGISLLDETAGYKEFVEDLAGNQNQVLVTAQQLNSIAGVSGAVAGRNYSPNASSTHITVDPTAPTVKEIQNYIDTVNGVVDELTLSAPQRVIENIAGNTDNGVITALQLNSIPGVSGAVTDIDLNKSYGLALASGSYVDPTNPTAAEIQAVIDSVNTAVSTEASSALSKIKDSIAGNPLSSTLTVDELNSLLGQNSAFPNTDYSSALTSATYVDPTNPTIDEIRSVIDQVNNNDINHTIKITAPSSVESGATVSMRSTVDTSGTTPTKLTWEQVSGTYVTLTTDPIDSTLATIINNSRVTFTAPAGSTQLVFKAISTNIDGSGTPATSTVKIDVFSSPYAISAGQDQVTSGGHNVSLHAKTTVDKGHPEEISWVQVHGTPVTLNNENTLNPTFVAPKVIVEETLTFKVTGKISSVSSESTVKVTVTPDGAVTNLPSSNYIAPSGSSLNLNSSTSGANHTHSWTQISGPAVNISGSTTPIASIHPPHLPSLGTPNPVVVQHVATNNTTGTTTIKKHTVHAVGSSSVAINTIDAFAGSNVSIDSKIKTPGGTHEWTKVSGPSISLNNANTTKVNFVAPLLLPTATSAVSPDLILQDKFTPAGGGTPVITQHKVNLVAPSVIKVVNIKAHIGSTVSLNAVKGLPAGSILPSTSYTTNQISGSSVSVTNGTSLLPSVAIPNTVPVLTAPAGSTLPLTPQIIVQTTAFTPATGTKPATAFVISHEIEIIPATPDFTLANSPEASVFSGDISSFDVNASGGKPPYNYVWSYVSGPTVTLDETAPSSPTFTAPTVTISERAVYSVSVTDSEGVTKTANSTVLIQPNATPALSLLVSPVATTTEGDSVTLHASAVGGSGGYTYVWNKTKGPSVTLDTSTDYAPTFVAPNITSSTEEIEFEVTVTDSAANSNMDKVSFNIIDTPVPPNPELFVTASNPQIVDETTSTTLTASAVGGDGSYTYKWTVIKGSGSTLDSTDASTVTLTTPAVSADTLYLFSVEVTDGAGVSKVKTVNVIVKALDVVVDAGSNINLNGGDTAHLSSKIVTAGIGPYSYSWKQITTESGVTLTDETTANPTVVVPDGVAKSYDFEVMVTDAAGNTDTDTLTLNADFLTANAGNDQTVAEGSLVHLHGLQVSGLGTVSILWTKIGGASVTLDNATSMNPSFTAPIPTGTVTEELKFKLTATDTLGVTAEDTVSVFVKPNPPVASVSIPDSYVENSTGSLTCNAKAGIPPYTYKWSQAGDFALSLSTSDTVQTIDFTAPSFISITDSNTISCEVTDSAGRTSTDSHGIVLGQIPTVPNLQVTVSAPTELVESKLTPLVSSTTGGSSPYMYAWGDSSMGTFTDKTIANPGYTAPLVNGDTIIKAGMSATDSAGANATDIQPILVKDIPLTATVNSAITAVRGDTAHFHADISGGLPPYTNTGWKRQGAASGVDEFTGEDAALDTTSLTAGTYKMIFSVTDSSTALEQEEVVLTVTSAPRTFTGKGTRTIDEDEKGTIELSGLINPIFEGERWDISAEQVSKDPTTAPNLIDRTMTNIQYDIHAGIDNGLISSDSRPEVTEETIYEMLYTAVNHFTGEKYTETATITVKVEKEEDPVEPVLAEVCSGPLCGIIPATSFVRCPTATPYALNWIDNDSTGSKSMEKRCASAEDCNTKWWHETSDKSECVDFKTNNIYNYHLSCYYCCTTDKCNVDGVPNRKSLFIGHD